MTTLQVGIVPIVRPLFRGGHMNLSERSRIALAALGADLGFTLAYTPEPVGDVEQARAVAREVEALRKRRALDFLIVEHVTFATGDLIVPLLETPVPAGLWALPEVAATGPLPQNALCGLNLSLSLTTRRDGPVKWFYGDAGDSGFRTRLETTLRALRGVNALHDGRLLWVGGTAPGFFRLESQPDLPLRVDRVPLDAAFDALAGVDEGAVEARVAEYDEPAGPGAGDLRATARLEIALERLAGGYDGVALRCWPELPDRAGSMACAPYARLADRGCAFACEGDLAGLASMLAVAAVTDQPAVLLDLSHLDAESLMLWHCGNAARGWAAGGQTKLEPHFNRGLPAVREMRLAPGPASGLRLLENRKAAVYAGEVLPRAGGFDGVYGWFGHLRWAGTRMTAPEFLASVLNHRLPHHLVWGRGDVEASLLELCAWIGHEPVQPDPEQTVLRWRV